MKNSEKDNESVGEFSQCGFCIHNLGKSKCKAFDFIPDAIFFDEASHDKPIEGQKGDFVFESKLK